MCWLAGCVADQIQQSTGLTVALSPVDLCLDDHVDCWNGGCVTERVVNNAPLLVNSNSSSFVGIEVTYVRSCRACDSSVGPWSDTECSAISCLNDGVCQQSWNGFKYVGNSFFVSLISAALCSSKGLRHNSCQ